MLVFATTGGEIHFGDAVPPGARVLADHSNAALLRAAVLKAGAIFGRDYKGALMLRLDLLLVPWYGSTRLPLDDRERVEQFAAKVAGLLPYEDSGAREFEPGGFA